MPSRPTWSASRPSRAPSGPPGLAALIDAERSALREHHERLRVLHDAEREAETRRDDVESAVARQHKLRRSTPGLRDRLRVTEHEARLLVADVRTSESAARSAVEAARYRVLASEQRLDEVRGFVDELATPDPSLLAAIRRTAALPCSTRTFPSIPAFIADREGRARGDRRIQDLIGRPLGDRWVLEDEHRPWESTRWRVAWACDGDHPSGEIYAVELVMRPHPVRRVLLFGAAPAVPGVAHVIEGLLTHQGQRNSLAALAAGVETVAAT